MRLQKPSAKRRGSALLLALISVIVIAGMTVALLGVGLSFNEEQSNRLEDEGALLVAEAGLNEAVYGLRLGKSGNVGAMDAPARFGNGLFWVEREDLGNGLLRLTSTGLSGRGRAALALLVFRFHGPQYSNALFSSNSFSIESATLIDSFDSTAGTYVSQVSGGHAGEGAIVRSNGDVAIGSSVDIYGDVHPGLGYSIEIPGSAEVTGSLEPFPENMPLAPVAVPPIPAVGTLSVPGGTVTLPPGNHGYAALTVTGGKLVVQGPSTLVLGSWKLSSNTSLVLDDTTGPIEIYVSGDTTLASNSKIETLSKSALGVAMYFTGGPTQYVDLRSNSSYYGTIYAPQATVDIKSNFEIFGSAVANQLVVNSNVKVHFDEALNSIAPGPETYLSTSWSLAPLPSGGFQANRGDPYRVLDVSPDDLSGPYGAHVD